MKDKNEGRGQQSASGQQKLREYTRTNPATGESQNESFPKHEHQQRLAEGWATVETEDVDDAAADSDLESEQS